MTRLETFADAAFAFSAALLAISIDEVPGNYDELILALKSTPAFAASLLVILFFWHGHQRWSDRYGLEDTPSVYLTFGLILMVMVYVYPLKILMASGFAVLCLVMAGLYLHAWRLREPLTMCAAERFDTLSEMVRWLFPVVFTAFVIVLIWQIPDEHVALVPFLFFLMVLFSPINDRVARALARRRFGAPG
jgi:uncharacterized membrane protein